MAIVVRCQWRRYPDGFDLDEDSEERDREGDQLRNQLGSDWDPTDDADAVGDAFADWWLTPCNPDRWEPYVLQETENRVCLDLANMPLTRDGVLTFANRWGHLGVSPSRDVELEVYEGLEGIAFAARDLKRAIGRVADGRTGSDFDDWFENMCAPWLRLRLRRGRLVGDTKSRHFLEANTLVQFCWAEFVQLLDAGVEFRRCPRCRKLLAGGKVGKPQIYCSDACLMAIYRKRKKKAEKAEKAKRTRKTKARQKRPP